MWPRITMAGQNGRNLAAYYKSWVWTRRRITAHPNKNCWRVPRKEVIIWMASGDICLPVKRSKALHHRNYAQFRIMPSSQQRKESEQRLSRICAHLETAVTQHNVGVSLLGWEPSPHGVKLEVSGAMIAPRHDVLPHYGNSRHHSRKEEQLPAPEEEAPALLEVHAGKERGRDLCPWRMSSRVL